MLFIWPKQSEHPFEIIVDSLPMLKNISCHEESRTKFNTEEFEVMLYFLCLLD